jgi:hypothetical protein
VNLRVYRLVTERGEMECESERHAVLEGGKFSRPRIDHPSLLRAESNQPENAIVQHGKQMDAG